MGASMGRGGSLFYFDSSSSFVYRWCFSLISGNLIHLHILFRPIGDSTLFSLYILHDTFFTFEPFFSRLSTLFAFYHHTAQTEPGPELFLQDHPSLCSSSYLFLLFISFLF